MNHVNEQILSFRAEDFFVKNVLDLKRKWLNCYTIRKTLDFSAMIDSFKEMRTLHRADLQKVSTEFIVKLYNGLWDRCGFGWWSHYFYNTNDFECGNGARILHYDHLVMRNDAC